ncbi:MAG: PAS domain S-box protein [Methanolinea sp.]|jgi:PAS domain S-box-containing protein|nr:PAS domain S-box protein [Methanolinea sp.]
MITVLLVHDNSDALESTRAYLERMGEIRVDSVHSTKQAMEMARRRRYDIIISYYRLPEVNGIEFLADMTGIELLRELKSAQAGIPFILYHRTDRDSLLIEDVHFAAEVATQAGGFRAPVAEIRDMIYQAVLRKKAERDQALRGDLLSAILSVSPLWLCQVRGGNFEWVNSTMARALGMDAGSLSGKSIQNIFPGSDEYDRALRELGHRVDDQGWGHAESVLRRSDGTLLPCRLRIRAMDPEDPARGQVLVCEDLSDQKKLLEAQKESDLRYREFLQNASSLIIKLDPEGIVTFFNKHAQAFFGYSEAEILGKRVLDTLIPQRARKGAADFVTDTSLNHEASGLRINEMMLRGGEPVWVAWHTRAIRDGSGHLEEVVCIGHDITDHEHRDRRRISTAMWRDTVITGTDIQEGVFDSVLYICMEIAKEGREGKQVGTAFIIGDSDAVLVKSKQLILNPFEGHPAADRMITNHDIKENIKELAQLDGAFVVRGDGRIEAAARYITIDTSKVGIPKGLGTRHSSVAGITLVTNAIGIVLSQSGGKISIFKNGRMVQEIA